MNAQHIPSRLFRVAIVDDEPTMRRSFSRLLHSTGYVASVYSSGREFLDACQRDRPDCAFIDCQMPGLSGVEVLVHLRRSNIAIPVAMLAAIDDADVRKACTALGTRFFLLKPADGIALLTAIESMVSAVFAENSVPSA